MGEAPDWYRLLSAARYLGVAPWELEAMGIAWVLKAETARAAENHAAEVRNKRRTGQQ